MILDLEVPDELHPDSKRLVQDFAKAMAEKLRAAEVKYGYSNGWLSTDWEIECRAELYRHAEKGDPRDVAIYAAFCWLHKWSTKTGGILKLVWASAKTSAL